MAISERKYQRLFEEAQADTIRIRKERDSALSFLRVIGRLSTDERIVEMCKAAVAGDPGPDTARLDAIERERATVSVECACCEIETVEGTFTAAMLREAIDMMIEATKEACEGSHA